ncbi:MAG TPA: hypothetical protein VFS08_11565 [Gemmatimonadaceae bacterium]|nr:hypothetical protein [Gemmatimonadaceae bacterium]
MRRKLSYLTLLLATAALAACASPTAPSSDDCGGVVGGSGTCQS